MTQPPKVSTTAKGRDGRGSRPVTTPVWLAGLRWCVVAAFAVRAALSLFDVRSVAFSTDRPLPIVETAQLGVDASLWPVLWGLLALVTAAALALKIRIAWLLAVAVTIAYLVAGIADVTALAGTPGQDPANLTFWAAIDLCVPLAILAGLLAIRDSYLPEGRPLAALHRTSLERRASVPAGVSGATKRVVVGAGGRTRTGVTGSTLDRWRRRN